MEIVPSAATGTATMFDASAPGLRFMFEAFGRGRPVGNTVRKPFEVGSVMVRLSTIVPTARAGM